MCDGFTCRVLFSHVQKLVSPFQLAGKHCHFTVGSAIRFELMEQNIASLKVERNFIISKYKTAKIVSVYI